MNNTLHHDSIHLVERPVESVFAVHVLAVLAGLVLGHAARRVRPVVVGHLLVLGAAESTREPQQHPHLLLLLESLQFLFVDVEDLLRPRGRRRLAGLLFQRGQPRLLLLVLGPQPRHAGLPLGFQARLFGLCGGGMV